MKRQSAILYSCAFIWLAIAVVSVFAPDLVSGSEQQHLPLAAITAWIWGIVATGYLALSAAVSSNDEPDSWRSLTLVIGLIWSVAAIVSVFGPDLVTGSDPTRVPLAALIAPPAAGLATGVVCIGLRLGTAEPDNRYVEAIRS
jgi:hypothetical protein